MSFADLLRQSRSSPTAVMHKFLTSYDPSGLRVYAFVEGDPDRAFYHALIEQHLDRTQRLYLYNCGGKRNVYDAFAKIAGRHPKCRNVLFFVDKDVDDIVGKFWPHDPRIFITDVYSIENYLVRREVVGRYFADFIKLRRVSLDVNPVVSQFDGRLEQFQRAIRPLMAWIIVMRRAGTGVLLSDIKLAQLFKYEGTRVVRVRRTAAMEYLVRVTGTTPSALCWKQVRRVCRELERQQDPKRYTRGKFEAWFLIEFVKHVIAELMVVASEAGGKVSVTTELHESNFVQLLVRGALIPASLDSFLRFHLVSGSQVPTREQRGGFRAKVRAVFAKIFGQT